MMRGLRDKRGVMRGSAATRSCGEDCCFSFGKYHQSSRGGGWRERGSEGVERREEGWGRIKEELMDVYDREVRVRSGER